MLGGLGGKHSAHARHGEQRDGFNIEGGGDLVRPSGQNYGALRRAGWRLLLLDSMDGLTSATLET